LSAFALIGAVEPEEVKRLRRFQALRREGY
jgi:hypothetical protein